MVIKPHLIDLDLRGNKLRGNIQTWETNLGKLTKLEWLSLYNNALTGDISTLLSHSLVHCPELTGLGLHWNQLHGNLQVWELNDMKKLAKLYDLHLHGQSGEVGDSTMGVGGGRNNLSMEILRTMNVYNKGESKYGNLFYYNGNFVFNWLKK